MLRRNSKLSRILSGALLLQVVPERRVGPDMPQVLTSELPPAPLQPCPHAGKQHSSANLAGKSYMYITKHVDGDVGSVWLSRTFSQRYRRGNRSERKTKGTKKNIPKI